MSTEPRFRKQTREEKLRRHYAFFGDPKEKARTTKLVEHILQRSNPNEQPEQIEPGWVQEFLDSFMAKDIRAQDRVLVTADYDKPFEAKVLEVSENQQWAAIRRGWFDKKWISVDKLTLIVRPKQPKPSPSSTKYMVEVHE